MFINQMTSSAYVSECTVKLAIALKDVNENIKLGSRFHRSNFQLKGGNYDVDVFPNDSNGNVSWKIKKTKQHSGVMYPATIVCLVNIVDLKNPIESVVRGDDLGIVSSFSNTSLAWRFLIRGLTYSQLLESTCPFLLDGKIELQLQFLLLECSNRVAIDDFSHTEQGKSIVRLAIEHDFFIVIGNERIGVHKALLSVHSSVFKTMFESGMQESVTNELMITDFPVEVVRSVVNGLYDIMSILTEIDKYPEQMLIFAHRYDVTAILELSENILTSNLTAENAIDFLHMADLYGRSKLKDKALLCISKNMHLLTDHTSIGDVLGSELWNELLTSISRRMKVHS